jgi:hypothetical protein
MVWDHITLPLLAVLALGAAELRAGKSIFEWLVNLGWDSCVLALGAAPAVFCGASAKALCGSDATHWGYGFMLMTVAIVGLLLSNLRSSVNKNEWHAIAALVVGGALLGSLVFVAQYPVSTHASDVVTSDRIGTHG